MNKFCAAACLLVTLAITVDGYAADPTSMESRIAPSSLLVIDQHRTTVMERIVNEWGDKLAISGAQVTREQLREMLFAMRADQLLAASLAGSINGLRDVLATALIASTAQKPGLLQAKALGDSADDVVYTPVTPCRLVETRGTFAAVYQGGGAFSGGEIRNYTIQGGNGVCLTQLPLGLNPSAVQLQVFGIPINSGSSGDIEILPQGSTFGSTATEVYVGNVAFNTVSTTAKINLANNQIGVQVRGGGADVAIDVVGYFKRALNSTTGAFEVAVNGNLALQIRPDATSPLVIAGSNANSVTPGASGAVVGGGGASGTQVTISGQPFSCGTCANRVTDAFGVVSGGLENQAGDNGGDSGDHAFATVGGGLNNIASGAYGTVGGGTGNTASSGTTFAAGASTVGGGIGNTASGSYSVVAGGYQNVASGAGGAIAGGLSNVAGGTESAVAGGFGNAASASASTVAGGNLNTASGSFSTVAGGQHNMASNAASTVAGGDTNTASGVNSFAAGSHASATGSGSTAAGGDSNTASGGDSFAAGFHANANGNGCFVFADSSSVNPTSCFNPNVFVVRALNGFYFYTSGTSDATYAGAQLVGGSHAWASLSDRNSKDNIDTVNAQEVLDKLVAMPIATWNWKSQDAAIRHMGPMAQDFRAAFGLGEDDKHITTVDSEGVALVAIQGLHQIVHEKDTRIAALEQQVKELQSLRGELTALKAMVAELAFSKEKVAHADDSAH